MKIFVSGYWNKNLGDDLFLKVFCEHYSEHEVFILDTVGSGTLRDIPNLRIIRNHSNLITKIMDFIGGKLHCVLPFSSVYDKVKIILQHNIDIYCELGGSIFILPKNKKMGNAFYDRKYLSRKLKKVKIPYFILGSNFGPFYSKKQLANYTEFFENVDGISFRDYASFKLFNQDVKKIQYAPDIVGNLKISKYKLEESFVLISVINPGIKLHNSFQNVNYFKYICDLVRSFLIRDEKVIIMSFCENEGDLEFAKKIKSCFSSGKVRVYNYENIEDSLEILAKSKEIVASRYHAMILAWLLRKPTFVISYSRKTTDVIDEYFSDQSYVSLDMLGSGNKVYPTFSVNGMVNNFVLKSKKQFDFVDRYIGTHK